MGAPDRPQHVPLESLSHPMEVFTSPRFTRKENSVKREIESYYMSDITEAESLFIDGHRYHIRSRLDIPDAVCQGLTFKLRLVCIEDGTCYLLARWKPDRYMRRSAGALSQKWFVEKELFPPDPGRFFLEREKQLARLQAEAEEAAASSAQT